MSFIKHSFLILVVTLAGCSSYKDLIPYTQFRTRITDSGLKHFQLRLIAPKPARDLKNGDQLPMTRPRPVTPRESSHTEKRLLKVVEDKILETQFCREGFWILDKNFMRENTYIRGECNETASDADRAQFPDTIANW